jgi:hypothetical protein
MHRTLLLVLAVLAAGAPVYANTTASTCMNITVTIEKFVMAHFGGDVTLSITQSMIEQHPLDARETFADPKSSYLHIQTNFNCDLQLILVPASKGAPPNQETLYTGMLATAVTVDGAEYGSPPKPPLPWWVRPKSWNDTTSTTYHVYDDLDLGPTASQGGHDAYWAPGRDYWLYFNFRAQNRNQDGNIPSWGTYSGMLCATMSPEEVPDP